MRRWEASRRCTGLALHKGCRAGSSGQLTLAASAWRDRIRTYVGAGRISRLTLRASSAFTALHLARVGVLLVSPNFLASDIIVEKELPPLLEAAEKDGLVIVWVPISASAFEETPIAAFQSAYNPATPLNSLSPAEQDQAWVEICKKIKASFG